MFCELNCISSSLGSRLHDIFLKVTTNKLVDPKNSHSKPGSCAVYRCPKLLTTILYLWFYVTLMICEVFFHHSSVNRSYNLLGAI